MGYVSDILDTKGREALGIDVSATVYEAIAKMVEGNVGALLVWDGDRLPASSPSATTSAASRSRDGTSERRRSATSCRRPSCT